MEKIEPAKELQERIENELGNIEQEMRAVFQEFCSLISNLTKMENPLEGETDQKRILEILNPWILTALDRAKITEEKERLYYEKSVAELTQIFEKVAVGKTGIRNFCWSPFYDEKTQELNLENAEQEEGKIQDPPKARAFFRDPDEIFETQSNGTFFKKHKINISELRQHAKNQEDFEEGGAGFQMWQQAHPLEGFCWILAEQMVYQEFLKKSEGRSDVEKNQKLLQSLFQDFLNRIPQ